MNLSEKFIRAVLPEFTKSDRFTLSSGVESNVYYDIKGMAIEYPIRLGGAMLDLIIDLIGFGDDETILAAPELGGVLVLGWCGLPSKFKTLVVRKAQKGHGLMDRIIGDFKPESAAVIIDDVATSGKSIIDTANVLRQAGLFVRQAVVVLDRNEGAKNMLGEYGIELRALITIDK